LFRQGSEQFTPWQVVFEENLPHIMKLELEEGTNVLNFDKGS
jgi:hypothetical protein